MLRVLVALRVHINARREPRRDRELQNSGNESPCYVDANANIRDSAGI